MWMRMLMYLLKYCRKVSDIVLCTFKCLTFDRIYVEWEIPHFFLFTLILLTAIRLVHVSRVVFCCVVLCVQCTNTINSRLFKQFHEIFLLMCFILILIYVLIYEWLLNNGAVCNVSTHNKYIHFHFSHFFILLFYSFIFLILNKENIR